VGHTTACQGEQNSRFALASRVAGNRACRRPFRPPFRIWPFAAMCRCAGRGADTRVGAAVWDMLSSSRVQLELHISFGFVSFIRCQRNPRNSSRIGNGGLKGRLHSRKPRSSRSPGLRRGRQFAHQRNCGKGVPRRGFHPLSWAEGPCGQARLPAARMAKVQGPASAGFSPPRPRRI